MTTKIESQNIFISTEKSTENSCLTHLYSFISRLSKTIFTSPHKPSNSLSRRAIEALELGIKPTRPSAPGCNGSFVLHDEKGNPIGIFKPAEMEMGCSKNPERYTKEDLIYSRLDYDYGTSYQRERAAYLLDKGHFANVPETTIVQFPRKYFGDLVVSSEDPWIKGSFQAFIPNAKASDEGKIDEYRLTDIHRIAALDLRIINGDRHAGNALVDAEGRLHPIDHGLSMLNKADRIVFAWMDHPHSKYMWTPEELGYIEELNIEDDLKIIKETVPSLSDDVLFRIRAATLLLQRGAGIGLSPYDIGQIMTGGKEKGCPFEFEICLPALKDRTQLEPIIDRAIQSYKEQKEWGIHYWSSSSTAPAA